MKAVQIPSWNHCILWVPFNCPCNIRLVLIDCQVGIYQISLTKKMFTTLSVPWIQNFNLYFCYSSFRCYKFGFLSEFIVFIATDWKLKSATFYHSFQFPLHGNYQLVFSRLAPDKKFTEKENFKQWDCEEKCTAEMCVNHWASWIAKYDEMITSKTVRW